MSKKMRSVFLGAFLTAAGLALLGCHCHYHKGPHRHTHHKDLPELGVSNSVEKYCLRRGYEPGTLDFKNCVHKRHEHLRQKKKIYQHEQMRREQPKRYPEKRQTGETETKPLPPPEKKVTPPPAEKKTTPPSSQEEYPKKKERQYDEKKPPEDSK